ncbi:MAG: peptidase inhibitor family I36 protein [Actinomycetota bacterium]|nr:peptidase inhibitor family I36 protein [Actinomycetota bacterium]
MRETVRTALLSIVTALVMIGGATVATADPNHCDHGEFCLWGETYFGGEALRLSLSSVNAGECVPLPPTLDGRSLVNLMNKHVTVYQSRECATEGEFDTYPGGGTYVPAAPFVVRAIQIYAP